MKLLNPVMLILYATVVMSIVLDVRPSMLSRKKQAFWLLYTAAVIAVSVVFMATIGQPTYGKLYVFLVQLPFFVEFSILSRYRGVKVLFALLSTVIFAAPAIVCVAALQAFCRLSFAASQAVYFLGYLAVALFTYHFLKADFNYMLENCENAQVWTFCAIPALYYVYSFLRTKYDFVHAYQNSGFWLGQLPTIITLVSYVLLIQIFRSVRETQQLQDEAAMVHTQMEAANLQLHELNRSQEQTRRYRHDMRHHFSLLQALAAEGDVAQITDYLHAAQSDLEAITPTKYCENETVNLLLSSFEARAKQADVTLTVEADLPEELPLCKTELCSLLSNSLENAIAAAAKVPGHKKKVVSLQAAVYREKLLMSVENPYVETLLIKDGLPQASQNGHGYGTRSIAAIAEAHGGQALFTEKNGTFILKVMIPLHCRPRE